MLIAIVGGGLQGVEIACLSQKAGFDVMVLDKTPDPPAKGLANTFVQVDICRINKASVFLKKADLVLPALENDAALKALHLWQKHADTPVCFDLNAYAISSSKQKSNTLFSKLKIPKPLDWPQCGFPVIVKPGTGSGSRGVCILSSREEWIKRFRDISPGSADLWIIQEYISGPSYSLEIIGGHGRYETLQVTELVMDEKYDCKRVLAPARITPELIRQFEQSARTIAGEINLNGIMDLEVILHNKEMKLLEIDARFPSQTPIAVYASTGVNMVEILANHALKQSLEFPSLPANPGYAILEHIQVSPQGICVMGENIMKSCGSLHLETNFWGADEAITNFTPGCRQWVATLIMKGKTHRAVREKREQILHGLAARFRLPLLPEINPYNLS